MAEWLLATHPSTPITDDVIKNAVERRFLGIATRVTDAGQFWRVTAIISRFSICWFLRSIRSRLPVLDFQLRRFIATAIVGSLDTELLRLLLAEYKLVD